MKVESNLPDLKRNDDFILLLLKNSKNEPCALFIDKTNKEIKMTANTKIKNINQIFLSIFHIQVYNIKL
jgi:hypothetical protein